MCAMDFSDDSLDDILSRTDDPVIPHVEDLASGPEPATSPAPNLPIGDLAITCISPTKERGKGKPCTGTRPSQEPDDPHFPPSLLPSLPQQFHNLE